MTLTIELTPEQEEALQFVANAAGMDTSEYARHRLVGDAAQNGDLALDEAEQIVIEAMMEDLVQTGARINQYLDKMNTDLNEMITINRRVKL